MNKFDSNVTTDPSGGPTPDEMAAMWADARRDELADYADYERRRARANRPILERAIEDEALYGEAA